MNSLLSLYKRNIYGVIGTLIFHILLILSFLLADVRIKGNIKDESIIIEFPTLEETPKENNSNSKNQSDHSDNAVRNLTTNRASNISAPKEDKFFDSDYQKEIAEARKLASDVKQQLKKEVVSLNDIKMPVDKTDGKEPESIKNVVYSGKSNIIYDLKNRYHLSLPIPIYLAQGGGTVIVDILVDKRGNVIKATSRRDGKLIDQQVFYYAELAATNTVFNPDPSAPSQQKGTIKYNFVAQ